VTLAPVAYFAFNRPWHTARSLKALGANPEARATDLFVFIDGPRNDSERSSVEKVVETARQETGFRSVTISHAAENLGLFRSITSGVSHVVAKSGKIIVLEDDIVVGPWFLEYMNAALLRYAGDPSVGSIHAYSPNLEDLPDYFFLPGGDCWGWATWADRWALFKPDASQLLREIMARKSPAEFASSHGWQSLLQLVSRAKGRNESWAILWHASLFLAGRLTLHPGNSYVRNIGNDGTGTHAGQTGIADVALRTAPPGALPDKVAVDCSSAAKLSEILDRGALRNLPLPFPISRRLLAAAATLATSHATRDARQ